MTDERETRVRHAAVAIREAGLHVNSVSSSVSGSGLALPHVTVTLLGDANDLTTFAHALAGDSTGESK